MFSGFPSSFKLCTAISIPLQSLKSTLVVACYVYACLAVLLPLADQWNIEKALLHHPNGFAQAKHAKILLCSSQTATFLNEYGTSTTPTAEHL